MDWPYDYVAVAVLSVLPIYIVYICLRHRSSTPGPPNEIQAPPPES